MKHSGVIAIAALAVLALSAQAPLAGNAWAQQMTNNCDPSDHLDNTTIPMARQKFEAAGYSQIQGYRKGCDNYWHAHAMKGGVAVNVVLSPDGNVMTEGD